MISCEFLKRRFFRMGPDPRSTLAEEIEAKFTVGVAEIQSCQQGEFPPIMEKS